MELSREVREMREGDWVERAPVRTKRDPSQQLQEGSVVLSQSARRGSDRFFLTSSPKRKKESVVMPSNNTFSSSSGGKMHVGEIVRAVTIETFVRDGYHCERIPPLVLRRIEADKGQRTKGNPIVRSQSYERRNKRKKESREKSWGRGGIQWLLFQNLLSLWISFPHCSKKFLNGTARHLPTPQPLDPNTQIPAREPQRLGNRLVL